LSVTHEHTHHKNKGEINIRCELNTIMRRMVFYILCVVCAMIESKTKNDNNVKKNVDIHNKVCV
jgi:hypothetical protein